MVGLRFTPSEVKKINIGFKMRLANPTLCQWKQETVYSFCDLSCNFFRTIWAER